MSCRPRARRSSASRISQAGPPPLLANAPDHSVVAFAQMLIFVGVTYGLARTFGLAPRVIAFGLPAVLRVRKAAPEIRVGILPSASVELAGDDVVAGERVTYRGLSRGKRVAIVVAPWIVVLGIAIACIGAEPALRAFVRGFPQLLLTPDLTPYVRELISIAHAAPVAACGVMLAKLAAMNLMPFGGMAGGMLLAQLAAPAGSDVPAGVTKYMMVSLLAWMLWTLGRLVYVAVQLAG